MQLLDVYIGNFYFAGISSKLLKKERYERRIGKSTDINVILSF